MPWGRSLFAATETFPILIRRSGLPARMAYETAMEIGVFQSLRLRRIRPGAYCSRAWRTWSGLPPGFRRDALIRDNRERVSKTGLIKTDTLTSQGVGGAVQVSLRSRSQREPLVEPGEDLVLSQAALVFSIVRPGVPISGHQAQVAVDLVEVAQACFRPPI